MKPNTPKTNTVLALSIATLLTAHSARATTFIWNNGAGDAIWDLTKVNWSGNPWVNDVSNDAVFGADGVGTINLGTAIIANKLTFDAAGYTLSGSTITLGGTTPAITANADATISSVIAGSTAWTKDGTGSLVLTGDNTNIGATIINGGTLIFKTPSFNTYRGGQIDINNGSILKLEDGGGAHRYDFGTQIYNFGASGGGKISTVGGSMNWVAQGNWTFKTNGGAKNTIDGATGMNMNGRSVVFDVTRGTDSTSDLDIVIGIGNTSDLLTKNGNGILSLSGSNGYSGATVVNGGTLSITGGNVQNSSSFTVNAGATLNIAATNLFTNGHGSAMENTKVITVNGGTLVFGSNNEARFGNVTLRNGATWTSNRGLSSWDYLLANTSTGAATVTVANTGGNTTASVMNGTGGIHLQGVQNFDVADVTGSSAEDLKVSMTLGGPGSVGGAAGGIIKLGAGTMLLTGNNTYTGGTTISGGTLQVGTGGTAGTLGAGAITLASGTTLDFRRSDSIDLTSGHLFSQNSAGNVTMNAGAGTIGIRTNVVADTVSMTSTNTSTGQALYGSSYATAINLFGAGGVSNVTTTGNQTYAGQVSIGSNVANQVTTLKTTGGGSIALSGGVSSGRSGYWSAGTLNIDTSTGNGAVSLSGTTIGTYGVANLNVSTGTGVTTLTGGSYCYDFSVFNGDVTLTANSNFQNSNQWVRGVTFKGNVTGVGKTLTTTLGNGAASSEGAGTAGLIFDTNSTQTVSVNLAGNAGPTKTGSGTTTFSGSNTYTGATLVSAGTLLVNGSLGNTAVTVDANGTLGGTGSIAGSLAFNGNSFLTIANINDALNVAGSVTFGTGFGINNITGWDYANAANGTYTLITGSNVNLANLDNVGLAKAYNLGNGRSAYFKQGSLQMVLVPEPATALLGAMGILPLLRRRRSA